MGQSNYHRPGIRHDGASALASAELLVIMDVPKRDVPDSEANVPMRGIEPAGLQVHDEVSLVEGRMFRFGTNEVIAGSGASREFANLNVGDTVISGQNRWEVVGIFEADGVRRRAGAMSRHCRAPTAG
jgi:putative ABC transport system permease protein